MWIARSTAKQLKEFRTEHTELLKIKEEFEAYRKEREAMITSQRNQLKAQIVEIYERAKDRGYITYMELDTLNRLADSYFALGGNHYIHAVVKKANNNMPVGGEEIPI